MVQYLYIFSSLFLMKYTKTERIFSFSYPLFIFCSSFYFHNKNRTQNNKKLYKIIVNSLTQERY